MPANKDGKTEEQYIQDPDENLAERPMHILDTLTLAKALYGMESPGSLSALCERHRTKHRKLETEHDQELTFQYLRYTMRDVQCTFELYQKLRAPYKRKGLPRPITSIYSAASIGKGYLEKLGVVPFLNLPSQPEQTTCRA